MRRYFTLSMITAMAVLGFWRGVAGRSHVAAATVPSVGTKSTPPGMSAAEWRYYNSQASHWRQVMLHHEQTYR